MVSNKSFSTAKKNKKDEFYTQLSDIENELKHYKDHFRNKVVLCNCDDPRVSNFFRYFALNFEFLGLKKLITTCYKNQDIDLFSENKAEHAVYTIYEGDKNRNFIPDEDEITIKPLKGDGDFRSAECIDLLKQADIVVTNPPFSLFREFVSQLIKYNKEFIILGNMNAVTTKEIFPLIKANQMWYGVSIHSGDREFMVPDDYELNASGCRVDADGKKYIRVKGVRWFTNIDHAQRHEELILYKTYKGHEDEYPKYDNYDAINVNKTSEIPIDYHSYMGVPITFLDKYNPTQFDIVGLTASWCETEEMQEIKTSDRYRHNPMINGKGIYRRIIIKRK